MTKVFLTSFPRSGHHFLVETASFVFPTLSYCEKYHCVDQWDQPRRCPVRNTGKDLLFECADGAVVQKSHDTLLRDPIRNSNQTNTLFLTRHPVASIISWWIFANGNRQNHSKNDFEAFFRQKLDFWANLNTKWLSVSQRLSADNYDKPLLYTTYHDLCYDSEILKSAIKVLIPRKAHSFCDQHKQFLSNVAKDPQRSFDRYPFFDSKMAEDALSSLKFSYWEIFENA